MELIASVDELAAKLDEVIALLRTMQRDARNAPAPFGRTAPFADQRDVDAWTADR